MSKKYTPTNWVANKTVATADVMNNIEQGIEDAHQDIEILDSQVKDNTEQLFGVETLLLNDLTDLKKEITIDSERTFVNMICNNININYSKKLEITSNSTFYNCNFKSLFYTSGTQSDIYINGDNITFINCTFDSVDSSMSTCGILCKSCKNISFINCIFYGNCKNELKFIESENVKIDNCLFEPIKYMNDAENIFQLKLSGTEDCENNKNVKVSNTTFNGDPTRYVTAIDTYTGVEELVVSNCTFNSIHSITIKSNWNDVSSGMGTCTDVLYPNKIILSSCIFDNCKNTLYLGFSQNSTTNIATQLPNSIIMDNCMIINSGGITGTDNVRLDGKVSDLIVRNCYFNNSPIGKIGVSNAYLNDNTIIANKKIDPLIKVTGFTNTINCITINNTNINVGESNKENNFIYINANINDLNINNLYIDYASRIIKKTTTSTINNIHINNCISDTSPLIQCNSNSAFNLIVKNSIFKNSYCLNRDSSAGGYGSGVRYLSNIICYNVSSIVNPSALWDSNNEYDCICY